jgi:hypothetical protein
VIAMSVGVKEFAKALHNAGKEAVIAGDTQNSSSRKFLEWGEAPPHVVRGRMSQARWILERFEINHKATPTTVSEEDAPGQRELFPEEEVKFNEARPEVGQEAAAVAAAAISPVVSPPKKSRKKSA